jgi:hypothetical protein
MSMTHMEERAERVREGHDEVLQHIRDLHSWWDRCRAATTTPFEELSRRILDLRPLLQSHFRDEEAADAEIGVDDLPEPSNQRCVLLADLDLLIHRLRVCQPGMDCWADAELAIDRFLTKLSMHEARELASLPSQ